MTETAFGPQGPNYTTVRPPADPQASLGADTWFKNCSAAGAKDGTFATAAFFNTSVGNLRYAVRTAGITLDDTDDTMLYRAMVALALTAPNPNKLVATRDIYVNVNTGLNTNDGLTPATPYRTIQAGVTAVSLLNLNGFTARVHVADGTYNESISLPVVSINGTAELVGNDTNWANVFINPAVGSGLVSATTGSHWLIHGFKVTGMANPAGADAGNCLWAAGAGCQIGYYNIEFGACPASQVATTYGGGATMLGACRISGSAGTHISCHGGTVASLFSTYALTITGGVSFSAAFIAVSASGYTAIIFGSITGTATGPKYNCSGNGVCDSYGNGVNYYPGSTAGSTSSGGQYLP